MIFLLFAFISLFGCTQIPHIPEEAAPVIHSGDPVVVAKIKGTFVVLGIIVFIAGIACSYILVRAGSFYRATGLIGSTLVVSGGCFLIAIYLVPMLKGLLICFGIAAIIGLVALVMHYRKHHNIALGKLPV